MDGEQCPGQITGSGSITVQHAVDGHVLLLCGDVDAVAVEALKATHPLDLSRIVAVDVGEVTFIDSTALTMLVLWARGAAAAGRPAEIRRRTPRFGRVLEMAGVADMFVYA